MNGSKGKARRGGFALLLTVVLIAVAGIVATAAARRSAAEALVAKDAAVELQRRWAVLSCQRTLLPQASQIIKKVEALEEEPQASVRQQLRLSDLDVVLVLSDETAKADANLIAAQERPERILGGLMAATEQDEGLRVVSGFAATGGSGTTIRGWGQVFESPRPGQLFGDGGEGIMSVITCWGTGKINVRRAPASVVEEVGRAVVGEVVVEKLLRIRASHPEADLAGLMTAAELSHHEQEALQEVLTDESDTYGLWIAVSSEHRRWHNWAVTQERNQEQTECFLFDWR